MAGSIIEPNVIFPSLKRALGLVPPEFDPAYRWFLSKEGTVIEKLPMGSDAPVLSAPIKLSSQRGMHSPNYKELPSKGAGKKKYVLSAYSVGSYAASSPSGSVAYEDADMIEHPDGTWTIEYACQTTMSGKKQTDKSNEYMMNNLSDGVPVGFMTRGKDGYKVHGLAYVEAFNSLTGMFTLHGPVSAEAKGTYFYSWIAFDDLDEQETKILRDAADVEAEAYYVAQTMKRRHQEKFRKALLDVYDGCCAVTNVSTQDVLQAAHIDAFAKSKSHAVTNGILLRSDIHLLYDAHLLTIMPDSGRIVVSEAVHDDIYRELNGMRIRLPRCREFQPDERLLGINVKSYNSCQRKMGLSCA